MWHCFISEIYVNDFFDWTAEIAQVLHIFAFLHDSALATENTCESLAIGVKSHCEFFDETLFCISEKDHLVVLRHLLKEDTQSRSLHDLKTDSKLKRKHHKR